MTSSYLDHPSEEALERFLLHHVQEDELDRVETHILACEACVSRLEELELHLAATKLALHELSRQPKLQIGAVRRSLKDWFTFRTLSWAGAVAALALTVTLTPRFVSTTTPAATPAMDVSLSAHRGSGSPAVPQGRPLHFNLGAEDIASGPVEVIIVDGDGSAIWSGASKTRDDKVEVTVPKLEKTGTHFLRLYSMRADSSAGELLREFPFEVK